MQVTIEPSVLRGEVAIPGSKSHTIRAIAIASLADGESVIEKALESADARAARDVYAGLGAKIDAADGRLHIRGFGGCPEPCTPELDVLNSGTTLLFAMGSAALIRSGTVVITGDAQIRRRPADQLVKAINDLGAHAEALHGNGCAPVRIGGVLRGGKTKISAVTSQYLSSLLVNVPLADGDTEIELDVLNEVPYVRMTLDWLDRSGIVFDASDDLRHFRIPGGQRYGPFTRVIPADYSSATFFLAAGAIPGNKVTLHGPDPRDTQGDREVIEYLRAMGADVVEDAGQLTITVAGAALSGRGLDLNRTPDALPMMAALACAAEGETRIENVAHARIKETDRIAVMAGELAKMGADIVERADGLTIRRAALKGAVVCAHDDHRVAMALAVAATFAAGATVIERAEAVGVTFPDFFEKLAALGAKVRIVD